MKKLYLHTLPVIGLGLGLALLPSKGWAQTGIGNGATAPRTMLDVNGAISVSETTAVVSGNAATIPTGFAQVRLTGTATAVVVLTGATSPAAVSGQQLVIYNPTTFQAVLNGQAIPAGRAASFVYSAGAWQVSAGGTDNLGNHTATQALNLQGNGIVGTGASIGTTVGIGVRADGGLNIGQNTNSNIAIGSGSGAAATAAGNANLFVGIQSGAANAAGAQNVFLGYQSGSGNTSGGNNTFTGIYSGVGNISGSNNVFSGVSSGNTNTTGANNVFLGANSGTNNVSGGSNTAVGSGSGPVAGSGALTNATALGANVGLTQSNTVILGNGANVGIGTTNPVSHFSMVSDGAGGGTADDLEISSYNASPSSALYFKNGQGTQAAPTNLATGSSLGQINFQGVIGGAMASTSAIYAGYVGSGTTNLSTMIFQTSGAERLRIAETGNVGIGTGAPKSTLEVNGSLAANYTNITAAAYTVLATDFYVVYNGTTASTFTLPSGLNVKGRLYNIKNTTAAQVLTLNTASGETIDGLATINIPAGQSVQVVTTGLASGTITYELVSFNAADAAGAAVASNGLNLNAGNIKLGGPLTQATTIALGANNLTFTATTGSLGLLGNTAGLTRAYFNNANTTISSRADIQVGANAANIYLGVDNSNSIYTNGTAGPIAYLDNRSGGRLAIGTSGNEQLTVLSGGNVGISTNNPTSTLDVNGTARIRTVAQTSLVGAAPAVTTLVPLFADATGVVVQQPQGGTNVGVRGTTQLFRFTSLANVTASALTDIQPTGFYGTFEVTVFVAQAGARQTMARFLFAGNNNFASSQLRYENGIEDGSGAGNSITAITTAITSGTASGGFSNFTQTVVTFPSGNTITLKAGQSTAAHGGFQVTQSTGGASDVYVKVEQLF